jgi:hypothetical protein
MYFISFNWNIYILYVFIVERKLSMKFKKTLISGIMPVWTIFFVWIWITHTWNLCKHCRYILYYFVVYANYRLLCHWPIMLSAYGYSPSSGLSALPAFGRLILWLWWAVSGRSRSCNRDVTMRAFTEPYYHHYHQQQYLKEADHATEMWPWEHSQSHIIIIITSSSILKKQIMQQRCDHESIHRAISSSSSSFMLLQIFTCHHSDFSF